MKTGMADPWRAAMRLVERTNPDVASLLREIAEAWSAADDQRARSASLERELGRARDIEKEEAKKARGAGRADAVYALADGWHALRAGGDVLIKDGKVVRVRDGGRPAARKAIERSVEENLTSDRLMMGWSEDGGAHIDDIPF